MKKNLLLIIVSMFLLSTSYGQLDKGSKIAGAQLNLVVNDMYYTALGFGSSGYQKHFGISLVPTYGYAIQRNWLLGVQATLGFNSEKFEGGSAYTSRTTLYTDFGLAPFTRLYLNITKNGKLKVFGVAALEFNIASQRVSYPDNVIAQITYSKTSFNPSIGGGIAYFGRRTSFDLSMGTQAVRFGFYKVIRPGKK